MQETKSKYKWRSSCQESIQWHEILSLQLEYLLYCKENCSYCLYNSETWTISKKDGEKVECIWNVVYSRNAESILDPEEDQWTSATCLEHHWIWSQEHTKTAAEYPGTRDEESQLSGKIKISRTSLADKKSLAGNHARPTSHSSMELIQLTYDRRAWKV